MGRTDDSLLALLRWRASVDTASIANHTILAASHQSGSPPPLHPNRTDADKVDANKAAILLKTSVLRTR